MSANHMRVAVPWSLTHYIPLNGFHPLYRALFDEAPESIELNAWDSVKVQDCVARDLVTRAALVRRIFEKDRAIARIRQGTIGRTYQDFFWPANQLLSSALPGDIEFHHTAPFPTLERPFVFHCESFAPVFLPFARQGGGDFENAAELREHYRSIFANPLCLGIFSHVPETLESLGTFFSDPAISAKLYPSRIGLSRRAVIDGRFPDRKSVTQARFLFVNSANQNPANFFLRGGHLVLRFWKEFRTAGRNGLLMLRCAKPTDQDLLAHGVDVDWIRGESGQSVIWAQDYLANHEMNALMASAHFFLLPSASLHSVSILQAMTLGTVPVVTDTVGTSVYVRDGQNGIVLQGVRAAIWSRDPNTGILVDRYERTPELDERLVHQLIERILGLIDAPGAFAAMSDCARADVDGRFSGAEFARDFWGDVARLSSSRPSERPTASPGPEPTSSAMTNCRLRKEDWERVFESPTQPIRRIYTGEGAVWALGGNMIHVHGNPRIELNDWSVLAQYCNADSPRITLANSIADLDGKYLSIEGQTAERAGRKLIRMVSGMLMPYPELHSFGSSMLKHARRYRRYVAFRLGKTKNNPDIELVVQGASGYNVVRYFHKYYAVPQGEGAFSVERVAARGYSRSFTGSSIESVLQKIKASTGAPSIQASPPSANAVRPVLAKEGFHGFNIIQYGTTFHAILQTEGQFHYEKIQARQYSRIHSGDSLSEVMDAISASLDPGLTGAISPQATDPKQGT